MDKFGLNDSHHIGKIVINPNNTNEIIVGSTGHLYSNSKQRGIFKSTDNGASWTNTLFIDDSTGIIDIKVSPDNPNIVLSSWKKDEKLGISLKTETSQPFIKVLILEIHG